MPQRMTRRDQKLGRLYVTSAPERIYTAQGRCILKVWVNSKMYTDQQAEDATVVLIGFSQKELDVYDGVYLPFDQPIDVQLDPGESLYAITFDRAFVGYSVVDFVGRVQVEG